MWEEGALGGTAFPFGVLRRQSHYSNIVSMVLPKCCKLLLVWVNENPNYFLTPIIWEKHLVEWREKVLVQWGDGLWIQN